MTHLDEFAHIGGFSGNGGGRGATPDVKTQFNGVFADPGAFNQKVKLLWTSYGTAENPTNAYRNALERAGIRPVYYESPGTVHEWQTWRKKPARICTVALPGLTAQWITP
jgi:S-formylglutathione hydrolase FrmB